MNDNGLSYEPCCESKPDEQYLLDLVKAGEVLKLFEGYTVSKAKYILQIVAYKLDDVIIRGE